MVVFWVKWAHGVLFDLLPKKVGNVMDGCDGVKWVL